MKRNVLVVDHDDDTRDVLAQILEPDGYAVMQAESGEQALSLAKAFQTDIFLLGVEAPPLNGIPLCRKLRAIEEYRTTPIILLAPVGRDALLQEALAAGADDFILKPYTPVAVQARLKIHLQRMEYCRQLGRLRGILKQYLPKRTIDAIENAPGGAPPHPEERDLAICFTDIRGFTAFSEETEPARLFSLVSELLAEQVNIIHDYGGYVDKFGGDGVMAVFDGPDMVLQSCLCALEMLQSARMQD